MNVVSKSGLAVFCSIGLETDQSFEKIFKTDGQLYTTYTRQETKNYNEQVTKISIVETD